MPVYLDIARLERVVMIVNHGEVSDEEVRKVVQDLLADDVAPYAKIVDSSATAMHETLEQVATIARMMREGPGHESRGPVAFVVDDKHPGFAKVFAEQSMDDRPIRLFTSLHAARQWVEQILADRE